MARGYDFSGLKILLIDDNRFMVQLVKQMLHAMGVRDFTTASDGESALKKIAYSEPDLIISDWDMDPVNGEELVRQLRDRENSPDPFLPIIMLTGFSEARRVVAARDFGVTEFLVKPLDAKRLYERLVNVVENPRPFIGAEKYFGPCRRRAAANDFAGEEKRSA